MQKIVFLKIENAIYKQIQDESRTFYFCAKHYALTPAGGSNPCRGL